MDVLFSSEELLTVLSYAFMHGILTWEMSALLPMICKTPCNTSYC